MMKKMLALLLTLTLALGLSACGGGKNGDSGQSGGGQSGGPVEVVFWHSQSGQLGDEVQKLVDEYNAGRGAEQGVHVTPVYQGYDGTDKQVLAYQTKDTANACDINVGLTSTIPSMMELGWTVPVSTLYETYGGWVPQDSFPDSLVESVSYQGSMVGMPFLNSTLLMYYNEDALKEAGFDAPPATLDELIAYTKALTVKDGSAVSRYGFECQVKRYQLVNYICAQSQDAYFGDLESGRAGAMTKVIAGENGTLKAFLEKWDELVETGGYQYVEGTVAEEFANQTTAMALFSSSKVTNVLDLVGDKFHWSTAPIPMVNAGDNGSAAVGGTCLVVFDRGDSDRLAGAWDFAQYLTTADAQYRISTNSGYVPTNKGSADLPEMQAFWENAPQYKTAFDIVMNAPKNAQEPMDLTYNEINTVITDVMRQFCDRQLTVDETVDAIVTQCNQLLDEWHEANS